MSFTQSHVTFRWKIEQKPEGGFIARSENPADTIEGATRDEVEAKMKEKLATLVGANLALNLDFHAGSNVNTHVEKKISFKINKSGGPDLPGARSLEQLEASTPAPIDASRTNSLLFWKVLVLIGGLIIILLLISRH